MAKKIFLFFVAICVLGFMLWTVRQYIKLPVVKYSVSQQRVVAVENFKGEALPFPPLPEKYEKIYVK